MANFDSQTWRSQYGRIVQLVEAGSTAFGLNTAQSDLDRHGIFIAPIKQVLSVRGLAKETHELKDDLGDIVLHEIGKFLRLALQGNPTILNNLWIDPAILLTEEGQELRYLRQRLLHKGSIQPFIGYAKSQLSHLEKGQSIHGKGGHPTGKWAMHLFRLIYQGMDLATYGTVTIKFDPVRLAFLRQLRAGDNLEEVPRLGRELLAELEAKAVFNVPLPDKPDIEAVNAYLLKVRLAYE